MSDNLLEDALGRSWSIKISVGDSINLRRELGIKIDKLVQGNDGELKAILSSSTRLVEILEVLLRPQIEERNLLESYKENGKSKQRPSIDFYNGFDGPTIDRATIAFLKAIAAGQPKLQRQAIEKLIEGLDPAITRASEALAKKIGERDLSAAVEEAISKIEF